METLSPMASTFERDRPLTKRSWVKVRMARGQRFTANRANGGTSPTTTPMSVAGCTSRATCCSTGEAPAFRTAEHLRLGIDNIAVTGAFNTGTIVNYTLHA